MADGSNRDWYLFGVAIVYMFAFTSLYTQVPGLYGPTGLLPVDKVLPARASGVAWYQHLLSFPSLVVLHDLIHIPPHLAVELCCVVGALLAVVMMVFRAMRQAFLFLLLWILYLSVYKVGQTFMWFQWDILLLEVGFLTILVAPFDLGFQRKLAEWPHTRTSMWLVRWLLFRLMFASGVVKLASHCQTWWTLTALNYHYESQCIPTPLAWYVHQFPERLQKISVVGMYFIEIAVPLLFLIPLRSLQLFSFGCQVFLQVLIMATGNYNFFNLITIVMSMSLLEHRSHSPKAESKDSRSVSERLCERLCGSMGGLVYRSVQTLAFITVVGYLLALAVYYFSIKVELDTWTISSQLWFSKEGFSDAVEMITPLVAVLASLSLLWEILSTILRCLREAGMARKCWLLLWTTLITGIVIPLFALSLVSHAAIDRRFASTIPEPVQSLNKAVDGFSISSSYGLFRKMTGVGGRPELVIEGSNDEQDWKEYEFLYKPGALSKAPVYVAPHQPRLDWQMWFAALSSYQHNPWLVHMVYRLLIGQKEVLQLIKDPPFTSPPRFIRAKLYHYHYTPYQPELGIFNQSQYWWVRDFQSDYLFPLTRDNQGLQDYLQKNNFLPEANLTVYEPNAVMDMLKYVRQWTDQYKPPWIIWALCTSGLLATLVIKMLFPNTTRSTNSSTASVAGRSAAE